MIKSIDKVKVAGRRVIVRAGFDVPLKKNAHTDEREVVDDTRIRNALPTLQYLIDQKAKIIILAKLGRPEGKWDMELSSWPVALALGKLLNYKTVKIKDRLPDYDVNHIFFLSEDITKHDYSELSKKIPNGSILYLENMFFYPGEEECDEKFAHVLKKFGDVYVEEAFASAHHKAASNYNLPKEMPAYAGISLLKEINSLHRVMKRPQNPFVVIMGGIKIEDKVETLKNLAENATHIIVGGGIANTFLKAQGFEVGKSKISDIKTAKELIRNYKHKIILPVDVVVAHHEMGLPRAVNIENVKANDMILDVGPKSIRKYSTIFKNAKTLVWNGPFGILENPHFAHGSKAIALMFAARSKGKAFGVVGGGETLEAINKAKVGEFIDHLSMGGGAMLEFLAGKTLPGIKVLEK